MNNYLLKFASFGVILSTVGCGGHDVTLGAVTGEDGGSHHAALDAGGAPTDASATTSVCLRPTNAPCGPDGGCAPGLRCAPTGDGNRWACLGAQGTECQCGADCASNDCPGPTDCHGCGNVKTFCSGGVRSGCVTNDDCYGLCVNAEIGVAVGSCCSGTGQQCANQACCSGLTCATDNTGCR